MIRPGGRRQKGRQAVAQPSRRPLRATDSAPPPRIVYCAVQGFRCTRLTLREACTPLQGLSDALRPHVCTAWRQRVRAPAEGDGEGAVGGASAHGRPARSWLCVADFAACVAAQQIFKFSVYVTIPVLLTVAFAGSPQNLQAIITNVRVHLRRTLVRAALYPQLHVSPCAVHRSVRTWSIPPRGLVRRAQKRFGRCVSADERVGVAPGRIASKACCTKRLQLRALA